MIDFDYHVGGCVDHADATHKERKACIWSLGVNVELE